MRRLAIVLAAAAALVCLAPAGASAGIRVTGSQQLTPRLLDVTMTTDALSGPVHTRVLLPDGYADDPDRRYPVLYLLHGGFGHVADWTEQGDAEKITAGLPLIVVMPEDGNGGWYTDWYNGGRGGPPRWETFDIDQLIPWVDSTYRTVPNRGGRAVAGLSTGGFGTMSLAARHPDVFVSASSYSGAVDLIHNAPVVPIISSEAVADGGGPDDVFGNRVADEIVWRAHNPWDLAANLRGLSLSVQTGNGERGPYDSGGLGIDPIEQQVHEMNVSFHDRLDALGVAHRWQDYGPGTHSWPYWQRDLRETLPLMLRAFANPPAAPSPFTYTSAENAYAVWGWSVVVSRPGMAFTTLADAGPSGFSLDGAGTATVTTGPLYCPGSEHAVRVSDGGPSLERADGSGRLHLVVGLPARVSVDAGPATCGSGEQRVCGGGKRVRVRVPSARGRRVRSVSVVVDGRRVSSSRVARRRVLVDLRSAAPGAHRVAVVVRRSGARPVRSVRTLRVCG